LKEYYICTDQQALIIKEEPYWRIDKKVHVLKSKSHHGQKKAGRTT
jgi:hypothetical protein